MFFKSMFYFINFIIKKNPETATCIALTNQGSNLSNFIEEWNKTVYKPKEVFLNTPVQKLFDFVHANAIFLFKSELYAMMMSL